MLIPRDYLFTPKNQNKSFIFKILKKTKNAMNLETGKSNMIKKNNLQYSFAK